MNETPQTRFKRLTEMSQQAVDQLVRIRLPKDDVLCPNCMVLVIPVTSNDGSLYCRWCQFTLGMEK